jgi:predicted transcriptional regulator
MTEDTDYGLDEGIDISLRPLATSASPRDLALVERRTSALRLRKEGYSYRDIAKELGVSDDTARNDVLEGLNASRWIKDEEALEVREMAKARNHDAIKAIYDAVLDGDLGAIDRLIKLNDQLLNMVGALGGRLDVTSGGKPITGPAPVHTIEVHLAHDDRSPDVPTITAG